MKNFLFFFCEKKYRKRIKIQRKILATPHHFFSLIFLGGELQASDSDDRSGFSWRLVLCLSVNTVVERVEGKFVCEGSSNRCVGIVYAGLCTVKDDGAVV